MAEKEEPPVLPPAPEGMIAHHAPAGCKGYFFTPDPDEYLPALSLDAWLVRTVPDALAERASVFQTFYRRAVFCEFHLESNKGTPIPITEKELLAVTYPGQLAYLVHDALEPLLAAIYSKKK